MIPVSSLHFDVLQQANHTDSEYLNELSVLQIDYYLNRGKNTVVEWLTFQDETNDTVRRYLAQLVVRDKLLKGKLSGNKIINELPADFYKQKAVYGIAKKAGCSGDRRIVIRRPTSEKFQRAVKNINSNRVWDFEETFAQEAADGLHVYTEPGVMIDTYLDYIRKVPDVAYAEGARGGSYIRADGERIDQNSNLELDGAFFQSKIVNIAVLEIKKDYSVFQDYQAQKDFILSIDRI